MRSRIHIPLVMLLTAWFGAIAPLHERGAVTLPGAGCAASAATVGGGKPSAGCGTCIPGKEKAPGQNPSRNCAVCHHMGLLDAAAPVFTVPCLAFVGRLAAPTYENHPTADVADLNRQRGPPMSYVG